MSQKIIDYTLNTLTPANPDSSSPAVVTGCAIVPGPPATVLGPFPQALDFSANGQIHATLPLTSLNREKFCVRVVFSAIHPVTARQELLASNALPFELYIVPPTAGGDFNLVASVDTGSYGPGKASTEFLVNLQSTNWYVADLVYDTDTLAVFLDGVIYSVHAFPIGTIAAGTSDQLFVGIAPNNADFPFKGAIAAVQLHADIPLDLESQLDERRSSPQWFLTYKQEEIKFSLAFGDPSGEFFYDPPSGSWMQKFPGGLITYQDGNGQAFEMHGLILSKYWSLPSRADLGYLISDEMNGARNDTRKNVFSRGGIYLSRLTGAVPVNGQIWVDYESMGEALAIGLPVSPAIPVPGGWRQPFQQADMFFRAGTSKAFEVHGAILTRYMGSGGVTTWGFPVSNEENIMSGSTVIGRISEFEGCTIYWSAPTGAFEVHGDIRTRYKNTGGPSGNLGFPTSSETNIPGAPAPARYNTFQNGSILWFGSTSSMYVAVPFKITLGRVDTVESEGWLRGQNDLYMYATIEDNGHVIHSERIPSSGDHGGNIYDINTTFDLGPGGVVPNDPNRVIQFTLDVWDSDWPDDDDHLGTFHHTLNVANAWGLRESATGLFNSGAFDNINSITWSVSPLVNEALLTESQKWWGAQNQGTDPLTYEQYASAFNDVDSDPEWWDPTDWLAKLFYAAVVRGLAKPGNCFGMSLEAIYSKKHRSILTLPLDRFDTWDPIVVNEFNIKHQYQVGAPAIWWFVAEFLSGKTHDPVSVFQATRAAYYSGCDPVLCISQNYDFSGAPHCILPIGWDDSTSPWKLYVHDPNFPSLKSSDPGPRTLLVDPIANTYNYVGASTYNGGEWSGGRLHFMPYSLLNERPRTPIFEAVMLLLTGVILILGSDSETSSLTDENGIDLNAFGADAINRLKAGKPLTHKFVSVKGFDRTQDCAKIRTTPRPEEPPSDRKPRGHGVLTSELYMRTEPRTFSEIPPIGTRGSTDWTRLTLKEYSCLVAPSEIRERLKKQPAFVTENQGRLMYKVADIGIMNEILGAALSKNLPKPDPYPQISGNFIHTVRSLREGTLQYCVKRGLTQFMISGETKTAEVHTISVRDLGSHTNTISIKGNRDKVFNLLVHHRLGAGNDYLRISVDKVPLAAGGELKINIKPGIGGMEVVSAGQVIQTRVDFEYVRMGSELKSTFELKEMDGLRVVPSTFITSNQLKVSRINKLFGDSLSSTLVKATV